MSKKIICPKICPKKKSLFGSDLAQFAHLDKALLLGGVFVQIQQCGALVLVSEKSLSCLFILRHAVNVSGKEMATHIKRDSWELFLPSDGVQASVDRVYVVR